MKLLSVFWHSVEGEHLPLDNTNPTVDLFREHLKFLTENYTPISVGDFLRVREEQPSACYGKPPVLLGFDDGFKNVIRYALPILEEFQVPAVFFVIGEIVRNPDFVPWYVEVKHLIRRTVKKTTTYDNTSIDLSSRHGRVELKRRFDRRFKASRSEPDRQNLLTNLAERLGVDRPTGAVLDEDLKFVDPKDLASLASSALLTVASHAMTHRDLATLTYEEQACELEQSDSLLRAHCPAYFPVVAYPNGSLNGNTVSIANRIYKAGFAVFLGSSYRNVYAYPRIGINHNSVQELAYAISPKRLNYILPIKRFLHVMGLRHMRAPAIRQGHVQ